MRTAFKKIVLLLLTLEARLAVARYKPHIIAVTGSVGKTSTKDAIYEVVAEGAYVRKSQKSFNSEIGLPLTILGRPNAWNNPFKWMLNLLDGLLLIVLRSRYPEWLVLEVGADRPGDIKKVAAWLPVTIAVITRLPEVPVHVEFFESAEQVVEEKAALIDALLPDGTLVLYADDARAEEFKKRAADKKIITFGFAPGADVRAEDTAILFESGTEHWPIGMSTRLTIDGVSVPIEVEGAIGTHTLLPALAAAAVGVALGKAPSDIAHALKNYEPPQGRMHLVRGVKDTLIIDDTYNSSPAAVVAALDALKMIGRAGQSAGIPPGRRIAVLGDMLELGRQSVEEHRKIGAEVATRASDGGTVDMLITVGFRARDIAEAALDGGLAENVILQYEDSQKAGEELAALLQSGDCVLVKGSQSMRMERAVKEMMAEPELAGELLVRQDEEWIKR
ncbi:MAG TPA: UDP-N-acetylmuramoyl-tripeptide--D-alanyl-D-alanine ligase [Candidatus Paceibacterota bacterium]|nr:UDP-N-acetylmuramoyl-tripeptide--D-alanyl-D-alanine ligase [Candidatus Paceibacterota bacterium]